MNYYKRHIGDYMKDASHLSLLEHGVYMRLLDVYYTRESAIPVDQAARLIGARSKDEREALSIVAGEFFAVVDGFYKQTRCEAEINAMQQKAETNREVGKRGGRPRKVTAMVDSGNPYQDDFGNPEITQTVSFFNPNETLATSHKPITNNHEYKGELPVQPLVSPDDVPNVPIGPARPSIAGAICVAMKAAGMAAVNPNHLELQVLIDKGADIGLFVAVARECVEKGKNFGYALATVKGRMGDAAKLAQTALAAPPPQAASRAPTESFAERDARNNRESWERMTGRQWPVEELPSHLQAAKPAPLVIDIEDLNTIEPRRLPA